MGSPDIAAPRNTSLPSLTVEEGRHMRRYAEVLRSACLYLSTVSGGSARRVDVVLSPFEPGNIRDTCELLASRLAEEYGLSVTAAYSTRGVIFSIGVPACVWSR